MRTVAIVPARMGSTRFPNKVMSLVVGVPLIELLLRRLSHAEFLTQIVVATSTDSRDDELVRHVERLGYQVFRGSEDDARKLDDLLLLADSGLIGVLVYPCR